MVGCVIPGWIGDIVRLWVVDGGPEPSSGRTVLRPSVFFFAMPNPYQKRLPVGKTVGSGKLWPQNIGLRGTSLFAAEGAQAAGHAGHGHQAEHPEQSCPIVWTPLFSGAQERQGRKYLLIGECRTWQRNFGNFHYQPHKYVWFTGCGLPPASRSGSLSDTSNPRPSPGQALHG